MIIKVSHNKQDYKINTKQSIDISIPYNFNGAQPNFYDVNPGKLSPFKFAETSYSVANGAGCNVPEISMNIHCTGTHTECVGHLLEKNGSVSECIQDLYMPTVLLTVRPKLFSECSDGYHVAVKGDEKVISKESIEVSYKKHKLNNPLSMIIRTLPNPKEKQFYSFTENYPPFFTNDSLIFLSNKIQHLVVDIPSIDRMEDDGILGNHRIFWSSHDDPKGSVNSDSNKTTESNKSIEYNSGKFSVKQVSEETYVNSHYHQTDFVNKDSNKKNRQQIWGR